MQALILSGSRNAQGQTADAAAALADGITKAGGQQETVFLPQLDIQRCRQCEDDGWGTCRSEGRCDVQDDFSALVEKVRAADAVAFVTPVYFSDLSESLRAFLDRLRRITRHENGQHGITGKPAVGICVAGGGGGGAPACAVSMEKILGHCGFDVLDLVPVRRQNLDLKRTVLEATGEWFVTQADSSAEA